MKTALSILTLASLLFVTPAIAVPQIGGGAPDFTGTDSTGKKHTLADFKGKYVVLEWLNHGCPFVKKHYGSDNMQKLQKEFTDKGVVWVSIVSSAPGKQGHMSPEDTNKTKKEVGSAATAVIIDEDGSIGRLYDAKTTPEIFVIDPKGTLIYAGAIDSVKSVDPNDIAKSTNYVRAALTEALDGKPVTTAKTTPYGCSVKY